MINGTLDKSHLSIEDTSSVGVYLVPRAYPEKTSDKYDIYMNNDMKMIHYNTLYKNINSNKQLSMIYGNIELNNSHLYSLSSRTMVNL